MGTGAFNMSHY